MPLLLLFWPVLYAALLTELPASLLQDSEHEQLVPSLAPLVHLRPDTETMGHTDSLAEGAPVKSLGTCKEFMV